MCEPLLTAFFSQCVVVAALAVTRVSSGQCELLRKLHLMANLDRPMQFLLN